MYKLFSFSRPENMHLYVCLSVRSCSAVHQGCSVNNGIGPRERDRIGSWLDSCCTTFFAQKSANMPLPALIYCMLVKWTVKGVQFNPTISKSWVNKGCYSTNQCLFRHWQSVKRFVYSQDSCRLSWQNVKTTSANFRLQT